MTCHDEDYRSARIWAADRIAKLESELQRRSFAAGNVAVDQIESRDRRIAKLEAEVERLTAEADSKEYYCGCEHHIIGPDAEAYWDEDGCCQVCGVDVDPWTIEALQGRAKIAKLEGEAEVLRREHAVEFAKWLSTWEHRQKVPWMPWHEVVECFRAALAEKE